jgi:alkanesulfonate monooxygenase SsuD/methylene tetrahydromethanopterin reductase-like flavin-dependent oxidoreductase (luciferase family)
MPQAGPAGGNDDAHDHLHLAVALDGAGWHPAAWREPDARPHDLFTARYWADLAAEAERGLLDFVTIEDSLGIQSANRFGGVDNRADQVRGRLDAVLIAARIAPLTSRIGLVPTGTMTHTEPFHMSTALATLDYVSGGRAGWRAQLSPQPEQARHFGRRAFPASGMTDPEATRERFDEGADFIEVVRRLWDSWEDDAVIRDVATGRFIDRGKLHYIDFAGRWFSVRGPSITPRPPQGQLPVLALAHAQVPYELAARGADIVLITPGSADHAEQVISQVKAAELSTERNGPPLLIYADLTVFLDESEGAAAARKERLDRLNGVEKGAAADGLSEATEGRGSEARAVPAPGDTPGPPGPRQGARIGGSGGILRSSPRASRATPRSSPERRGNWPACCWTGGARAWRASGCGRARSPTTWSRSRARWSRCCKSAGRSGPGTPRAAFASASA